MELSNNKTSSKIKLMCQKFEKLDTADNNSNQNSECITKACSQSSNNNCTPIAPTRKKKVSKAENINSQRSEICSFVSCDTENGSEDNKHNLLSARLSVRERTKLFETSSSDSAKTINDDRNFIPAQIKHADPHPCKPPRTKIKFSIVNHASHPKHNEICAKNIDDFTKVNLKFNPVNMTDSSSSTPSYKASDPLQSKTSSKVEIKFSKERDSKNDCKNMNSATIEHFSKTDIKIKLKNIFVDLTPTTVSPPKNHDTLKRSHSEEHIYAVPFENDDNEVNQTSEDKPLHYMCTPIFEDSNKTVHAVNTNVPSTNFSKREPKLKKSALRRCIYESFSALRRPTKYVGKELNDIDYGDDESEISIADVQNRIIYVKSIKREASVSSLCIAPKLFETILIINISQGGPDVIYKYPQHPTKVFDYPLIPQLCFPDYNCLQAATIYKSEFFHLTLIDGEDERIFGYCHRILGWPEQSRGFCYKFPLAVCILTRISAPLFYKKILVEIEKHLMLPISDCSKYLASLRKLGVPNAGASLSISNFTEKELKSVVITRPLDSHSIKVDMTRTLQLLDANLMMKALSSLLLERRVLLLSKNSWNVLNCVNGVSSLLYPLQWQHLLIPILPSCLMVQCCSESPYLLGIVNRDHNVVLDLLSEHQLLIIDVDKGVMLKSVGDEDTILPKKIYKAVIGALNLAKNMTDPTEMMRDVMISEAVIHMFVEMLGHIENHVIMSQTESLTFQKEAFQKSSPSNGIQAFLQWFSESQMFEVFVEEYIWRINYRKICQSQQFTLFEKRVEEYKWELTYENDKIVRKIGKTVKNIGERLKNLTKELL